MTFQNARIKNKAICVFKNEYKILVSEYFNPENGDTYYRPIGGNIEFGESSGSALKREINEEIGAEISNLQLLDTVENIYFNKGKTSHEILFIYEADFINQDLYNQDVIEAIEDDRTFDVIWKNISDFVFGDCVLYPKKLIDLIGNKMSSKFGSSTARS
jgi:8-oxo-dGTP pyrophosphatase MutT (NUDIX family)